MQAASYFTRHDAREETDHRRCVARGLEMPLADLDEYRSRPEGKRYKYYTSGLEINRLARMNRETP